MDFWRVLNWSPSAKTPADNGHPLYVWPRQGAGRVDDPDRGYLVLYLGDSPVGATAEAFGGYRAWSPAIFEPPPATPSDTVKALVRYTGDLNIMDLDDPFSLYRLGLRPSSVVTRNRATTQRWARAIHDDGDYAGVSWWSYYEPSWASFGLWDITGLEVAGDPERLALDHPAVLEAAHTIMRPYEPA